MGNDFLGSFERETATTMESVQVNGSISDDHQVLKRLYVVYRRKIYSSEDKEDRYEKKKIYTYLDAFNLIGNKSKTGFIFEDGESIYSITETINERNKAHLDITTKIQTMGDKVPGDGKPSISFQFR